MPSALFPPLVATGRLRRAPARIVAVVTGPNPSFDYYLAPRLAHAGIPFEVLELSEAPTQAEAARRLEDAFVLFCRYASSAWIRAIEAAPSAIADTGLFIDDDIDALAADSSVPLWYRLRLLRLHLRHRKRLGRVCGLVFAGTPLVAERLMEAQPRVLTPIAGEADLPVAREPQPAFRLAFHSTSVHAAEHRWLKPVVRDALAAEPSMTFETMVSAPLSWRWRGLPRTVLRSPMPWSTYRTVSRETGADLLLAPLLPGVANAARSWTKRIDAMRLGAALLVSDANVYRPDPEERALGMYVPMESAAWTRAIVELAQDRTRLARLRDLNRAYVLRESAKAGSLIPGGLVLR